MPRIAASLSSLFCEVPFLERFDAAARAGFKAVECRFPYDHSPDDIARALKDAGLAMVMFNLPGGDAGAGELGLACLPGREDEFRQGVERAVDLARILGVDRLNCLAGIAPPTGHRAVRETLVANLAHAATALNRAGMTLLVEPLNGLDHPGFYLTRTRQVTEILDDVGAANTKLQYDTYHMQLMEGDLAGTLARLKARIGHIQISTPPERGEPGTGEIDLLWLLGHMDRIGYDGWVGCEFTPSQDTARSLAWAKSWLTRNGPPSP